MLPLLTFAVVLVVGRTSTHADDPNGQPLAKPWFDSDCSDPRYKTYIECHVKVDGCDQAPTADEYPSKADDFRVQSFVKAVPRYGNDEYELAVDISWQSPIDNKTDLLQGFALTILPEGSNTEQCYLFRLKQSHSADPIVLELPRFRFVTDSVFEFGRRYNIELQSLPRPVGNQLVEGTFLHSRVAMPHHPVTQPAMCFNCCLDEMDSKSCCPANPYAARWVAGFRRIFLNSLARTIQIEFIGAPEHYCFEAYEVRLSDESGKELLHRAVVTSESMRAEVIENRTVLFGEYIFTNLELDKEYIPEVLPIERAADGRCLCPVDDRPDTDLYDLHIVCSCLAAAWEKVQLKSLQSTPVDPCNVPAPPPGCRNETGDVPRKDETPRSNQSWSIVMILILAVMLAIVLGGVYNLVLFYQRYRYKSFKKTAITFNESFLGDEKIRNKKVNIAELLD